MSRWIDADAVKINYIGGFKDTFEIDYDSFMNAPSIDIVRCKECEHWESPYKVLDHFDCGEWCQIDERNCKADDYCSYGERKESE